MDIEENSS